MEVEFKKLKKHATIPTKAHGEDSGFDLYAAEGWEIPAGSSAVIKTGIAVNLPEGYGAEIRPRSGVSSKTPLRVVVGTIDNGYVGELGVMVDNIQQQRLTLWQQIKVFFGGKAPEPEKFVVEYGAKIAQLVLEPIPDAKPVEVTSFSPKKSERGDKGFGSTGGF